MDKVITIKMEVRLQVSFSTDI